MHVLPDGELDVIVGGGEVGSTVYELMKRVIPVAVIDLDESKQKLPETKDSLKNFKNKQHIRLLHVCVPFTDQDKFIDITLQYANEYKPKVIVIHSTISRGTTVKVSNKTEYAVIYSAIRGVHTRFLEDVEYYTKFWSTHNADKKAVNIFRQAISDVGLKTKQMSTPDTLELAKLLTDTTYYGWLISYAQKTKMICDKYGINYDEMWQFAEEIHSKAGNRPKMFPGFIGGHCVIPNLALLDEDAFAEFKYITEHNDMYKEWMDKDDEDE